MCKSHNNNCPCLLNRYNRPARVAAIANNGKSGVSEIGCGRSMRNVSERTREEQPDRCCDRTNCSVSCKYNRKLLGPLRRNRSMNNESEGKGLACEGGGGGDGVIDRVTEVTSSGMEDPHFEEDVTAVFCLLVVCLVPDKTEAKDAFLEFFDEMGFDLG